ncbi:MAG: glycosyltransferase [Proteobacteria bacterium]|nr:glycosyltransferase [Pseudomonadota bacterium]
MVRLLWLTLCDPFPTTNGQFLYSAGLIGAVAKAGARVTVLGLRRPPEESQTHGQPGIEWCLSEDRPPNRARCFVSRFPPFALRTYVPDLRAALETQLRSTLWDAVVLDSFTVAWALPRLVRYRKTHGGMRLAYLAQNNETAAARHLSRTEHNWRRYVRLLQTGKTRLIERQLVGHADLVTADAPEDCLYLSGLAAGRSVLFVPPGYEADRTRDRVIDESVPRRAVIVGSFDWPLKRASLEAFLAIAEPRFARSGIELHVIGRTEPSYVEELRVRFRSVRFTGTVPEVRSHMANARIGLVVDLVGGFKLKSLDYVFGGLPIFGIDGAVPGLGFKNGEYMRLFRNHDQLARAVVDAMDDLDTLNRMQRAAFDLCRSRFEWDTIGQRLLQAIREGGNTGPGLAEYSHASVAE